MPSIKKTAENPFFKSKYAALEDILPVIVPILRENGLMICSYMDTVNLVTEIVHIESGEKITSKFQLPLINDIQKMGAGITYARRYSLVSMLNLNVDEDNDGNQSKEKEEKPKEKEEKPKDKTPFQSAKEQLEGTEGKEALTALEKKINASDKLKEGEKKTLTNLIKLKLPK